MDLISRQEAIDICNNAIDLWNGQIGCGALVAVKDRISGLPSAEPNDKLRKIADLVDGTIDHLDLDDAMDLLHQIKDVCEKEML